MAVAVACATGGMGAGLVGATTTSTAAMANAAFTTLVTQASTALIANGGNLGAALRTLGSSASVKSLVASIATAGLENVQLAAGQSLNQMSGLSNLGQTGRSVFSGGSAGGAALEGITGRAVVSAGVDSAVLGQSFGQGLVDSVVADASAIGANGIGGTYGATGSDPNAAAQALAHGMLGCAEAGLTGGHCASGAAGAAAESVLGDVVTAAGGLPTDASGQVTTGAAVAYETGAAALGALAGQAAGGDAQSGLNTAVNSAANNYMAHVGDYVKALNACQQNPGGTGCGTILKMAQGSGVPIGSTPSGYAVAANVGADGAPTGYVVTSPSGRQMILQPQEWNAFSQMTAGQQATIFSAPQWSLDATSAGIYLLNGDVSGAPSNYGHMFTTSSYWVDMGTGLVMGYAGALATLPETAVVGGIEQGVARSGASTSTAIQTYWPPNGGFVTAPVNQTLETGALVSRYGGFYNASGNFVDFGNFVAPSDVPYGMRALPAGTDTSKPLSVYKVLTPIPDVPTGLAAPWFGELGLGVQRQLPLTIQDYLDSGTLELIKRTNPSN